MLTLGCASLLSFCLCVGAIAAFFARPEYGIPYVAVGFIVLLLALQLGEIAKRQRRVAPLTVWLVQGAPCVALLLALAAGIWRLGAFAGDAHR